MLMLELINHSGLYQGTTFSRAERYAGKVRALALAKTGLSGAEAQVFTLITAWLKPCPDTKRLMRCLPVAKC
jgi:hypothetical protein